MALLASAFLGHAAGRVSPTGTPSLFFYALPDQSTWIGEAAQVRLRCEPIRLTFESKDNHVAMRFIGAREDAEIAGEAPSGAVNRITAAGKTTGIAYRELTYRSLFPGIDFALASADGHVKSEFRVAAGADPHVIGWTYENGAARLEGERLVVESASWEFAELPPYAYQEDGSKQRVVDARFVLREDGSVGFAVGDYDRSKPLIIDPVVEFSTLWGGSRSDTVTGVAIGPDGAVYATGWTESVDLPSSSALQSYSKGSLDAFVMKLSAAGHLVYATYIGGTGYDVANAIALDGGGNAYITGSTNSWDFPLVSAWQPYRVGVHDAFLLKLAPTGGNIVFSTYLGGTSTEAGTAVQVDASGASWVAGHTSSTDFPIIGAMQSVRKGARDAFVSKFGANGVLAWSTYLGGSNDEEALGLFVRGGDAYVVGRTSSIDFPTAQPVQAALLGPWDAFATKLSAAGTIVYSTMLGGTAGIWGAGEAAYGVTVNAAGEAYIVGTTNSANFPVRSAAQAMLAGNGSNDAFITKLNAAGNGIVFSTFFGGSSLEVAKAVALDGAGNAYVAGYTTSFDFPKVQSTDTTAVTGYDGFLAVVGGAGKVASSSSWGGSGDDIPFSVAVMGAKVVVGGQTQSWNYPLKNAISSTNGGNIGGFLTAFRTAEGNSRYIGVVRGGGQWWVDSNGNRQWEPSDRVYSFGLPGDLPVVGDWDGSGKLKIGVYRNGQWWVDYNGNFGWDSGDRVLYFGLPGDQPVLGDWDGSGKLKIGIYRNGQWWVDYNGNFGWDSGDRVFYFGLPGDQPVVGDWDGSGKLKIGVYRNGQWWVDYNGNFGWDSGDRIWDFGLPGDVPIVADWDNTGVMRLGVYRGGWWYVDWNNSHGWDAPDTAIFAYGLSSDTPVIGQW